VGIAGQNELNGATLNQNIVVTLPGSTRFFLVLQKGTMQEASLAARGKSRHVALSIDKVICKKILQYGRTGIKC
jgi:hypothetical protein